ncbi:MAG: hypothetical protein ACLP01_21835 [Solirubrobacteraceae bacterium]
MSGLGEESTSTGRLTGSVLIALAAGVNTALSPTSVQQLMLKWTSGVPTSSGWNSACMITTCIGPVIAPTLIITWVIVPSPLGGNWPPRLLSGSLEVHRWRGPLRVIPEGVPGDHV